jgi:hypothetical protein
LDPDLEKERFVRFCPTTVMVDRQGAGGSRAARVWWIVCGGKKDYASKACDWEQWLQQCTAKEVMIKVDTIKQCTIERRVVEIVSDAKACAVEDVRRK